jgi:hypothetical protein
VLEHPRRTRRRRRSPRPGRHAVGAQRGDHQSAGSTGVPVAGRRPQGSARRSPGRGGCPACPAPGRTAMAEPVGVAEGDPGEAEQRPRVVAQPAGGVVCPGRRRPVAASFASRPAPTSSPNDLVGGRGGQEAGEQPLARWRPTRGSLSSRSAVIVRRGR